VVILSLPGLGGKPAIAWEDTMAQKAHAIGSARPNPTSDEVSAPLGGTKKIRSF